MTTANIPPSYHIFLPLVTRLERDGLVSRELDHDDRRRWFTVLTDAGDDALRAARITHNDVLRRSLLPLTSAEERRVLRRLWRRLKQPEQ